MMEPPDCRDWCLAFHEIDEFVDLVKHIVLFVAQNHLFVVVFDDSRVFQVQYRDVHLV